jgi:C-3',4' desaturase CrtD
VVSNQPQNKLVSGILNLNHKTNRQSAIGNRQSYMSYEVIVIGSGIGGLTVTALLAARGVSVCLFERESQVGGCASSFEKFGDTYQLNTGIYAGWNKDEIHAKVFDELKLEPPETKLLSTAYSVRLPDLSEIAITKDKDEFEANLYAVFPECADAAIEFYRELEPISEATNRLIKQTPDLLTVSGWRKAKAFLSEVKIARQLSSLSKQTTAQHLTKTSHRFKRFIDAQLQIFALCPSDECAYLYAAVALMLPQKGMHTIEGGAKALTDLLVQSIKQNGGKIRLNSPVLRLAYDSTGKAIGVDLLSGERVEATKTIVSNLTVQDTFGRLVGLNQTPNEIRSRLKKINGWGAYQIFMGLDESVSQKLSSERILALSDWQEQNFNPEESLFMFSINESHTATFSTFTEAEQWFAYHESEDKHEAQDQAMLEKCWAKLHLMIPKIGNDIEVIETMTPRDYFELTRRHLGMVGGVGQSLKENVFSHRTHLPNLFMVGDSVFPGNGIAAVTQSALIVANEISSELRL